MDDLKALEARLAALPSATRHALGSAIESKTPGACTDARATIAAFRWKTLDDLVRKYAAQVSEVEAALQKAARGLKTLGEMQSAIDTAAGEIGVLVTPRLRAEVDSISSLIKTALPDDTLTLTGVVESWAAGLKAQREAVQ